MGMSMPSRAEIAKSSASSDPAMHSPSNTTMLEVAALSIGIPNSTTLTATSPCPMDLPVMDDNFLGLDPFFMAFDEHSVQLLPQVRENIYDDIVAACGYPVGDYNTPSWMGTTDSPDLMLNNLAIPLWGDRLNNNDQSRTSTSAQVVGAQHQRRVATAYDMLRQYSTADQPSRPSSPKSVQAHNKYLQELGRPAAVACDPIITNIFIGLFCVYVAPALPCFRGQVVDSSIPEELSLAMAAVGGLFCKVAKSASIARWLFHTAQRKLNTLYILMDVFAYIYGDKRVLLLYEVYHGQVIQEFCAFNGEGDDGNQDSIRGAPQKKLLADTMYLLECYRVVILQLPSRLYPTTMFGGVGTDQQHTEDLRQSLIRAMTTYDLPQARIETSEDSIQSLCSLALLASHGRQLPGSLMALLKSPTSEPGHLYSNRMGLQQEYIELALQKWRMLHTTPPTASAELLFHLIHLNLYCSYAEIEGVARASQQAMEKGKSNPTWKGLRQPSTVTVTQSDSERKTTLRKCFTTLENLKKATWHADQLLDIAADIELVSFSCSRAGRIHLHQEARRAQPGEPIHFAQAVYHATMVLRLSSTLLTQSETSQSVADLQGELDSITRRGIQILSRSAGRIAGVSKQVLESLRTTSQD
ncbi:hypothetical protein LTR84_009480 [Exophiala bonariae]|uniref:Transcription factor domain-containing protein n=1 Tax=Exophiala bonariae TaxID=1690606 RepID=A0AAV9MU48_9EURO|nr:hypothetical protein LTR84_009480 [Exophiala bonariae]